ncbi:MAG TPA: Ig-like domain-containing domain [Sphingobacteriaceae bacterium]
MKPPKVVRENPENLTRNFKAKSIVLEFDEFIKLNNEANEVAITPALDRFPIFKARKENLDITFEDTLEKNTTYTINFGKAIGDVNENNILTNYTYVFSTGPNIDSLILSGSVQDALTKEKLKDVTVFILPTRQDTLFGKKRASIFTTTDTAGNFRLTHLREDTYRIYALKEQQGGDRIYNSRSEDIGFVASPITLTKDSTNILLQVFNEVPDNLSVTDRKIENDGRITMVLNRPAKEPSIRIAEPAGLDNRKTVEFTTKTDSALIWLPEMTFDSLKVVLSEQNKPVDTITLRRNKRDTYTRTILLGDNLSGGRLRPGTDLILTASAPIASINNQAFTLLQDSVATTGLQVTRVEGSSRKFMIRYPWRLNRSYILNLADNAFTDITGTRSRKSQKQFTLDDPENYGNLTLRVTRPDTLTNYLVELLDPENLVLKTDSVPANGVVEYRGYPTGKYGIRIVYDINKNGRWDTGNLKDKRQPEPVFTIEKQLTLRPNWDLEEVITIPKLQ